MSAYTQNKRSRYVLGVGKQLRKTEVCNKEHFTLYAFQQLGGRSEVVFQQIITSPSPDSNNI
jgi:hypothetical protein